jgi:TPR repeat protein
MTAAAGPQAICMSTPARSVRDYAEALRWFRKGAEHGNAAAQGGLGQLYASGLGVAKNYAVAVSWFRKAADQGDAYAQVSLGQMVADAYVPLCNGTALVRGLPKPAQRLGIVLFCPPATALPTTSPRRYGGFGELPSRRTY